MLSLCGCSLFASDTAELLAPPALEDDMADIYGAITKTVNGGFALTYPSRGDYRSAIIRQDINKDGTLEAFAFYSTQDAESTVMHINAVVNEKTEWRSVATQEITAGGVDRVMFCDLDGDGTEEILVGWEIYGSSELQLAVYSMGTDSLTVRMLEKYTHFITCDLDEDDRNEVFVLRAFPTETTNTASLYSLSSTGITEVASCEIDSTVKTVNMPKYSHLSTGKPAIYIDEIKGVGAVTEVLFTEKGNLLNPLIDETSKETVKTLRSATLEASDINSDGILEIPVSRDVPSVVKSDAGEKLYLTEWCSFNGETLTSQLTAMINQSDRYYYCIPEKWSGKIAVLRDSQNSVMEIYRYSPDTMTTGERLLHIRALNKSDWVGGKFNNQDLYEIVNNGDTTFVCNISAEAQNEGIDLEKVKADFKLF